MAIICCLFVNAAPAAAQFRTVVLTGQQVPGAPVGTTFTSLSLAGISVLGQTAMIAETDAGPHLIVEHNGVFRTVTRQGDSAPDAPGGLAFNAFPFAVLNDAGQVAFVGDYSPVGSGNSSYAVWSEAGAALHAVALFEEPMPGATGPAASAAVFREISIPAFNSRGDAAIIGDNSDCSSVGSNTCYQGAFLERESLLAKLAITNDNAPEVGGDFFIFPFSFHPIGSDVAIALNDAGDAAFVAETDDNSALWLMSGGGLAPVIVSGSPAPNVSGGEVFAFAPFGAIIAINNARQLAVNWSLDGAGVTESNNSAIWAGADADSLRLVAREGDTAPGSATQFPELGFPVINARGDILFTASIDFQNIGIWRERAGTLEPVALADDAAPDLPAGAVFEFFNDPTMNAAGQVAFAAVLKVGEGGVTEDSNSGLWASDVDGVLHLVARAGDEVDVDNGPGVDLRIFSGFSISHSAIFFGQGSGNEDGRPSYFNDRGQLAFWASFTDGTSGVFISDAVAVPESSGRILLAIACMIFTVFRCKR
jgi:hypothetical protein